MDSFKNQIIKIVNDRQHGSSYLLQEAINAMNESRKSISINDIRWAMEQLRTIDPAMSVVHHLIRSLSVMSHEHFYHDFDEYREYWKNIDDKILVNFERFYSLSNKKVLTHSHSGTTIRLLASLSNNPKCIYQTRSVPGNEGEIQAKAFRDLGLPVILVNDDEIDQLMPAIDICILGCDQYTTDHFINKTGSEKIVEIASRHQKPVVVVADSRKEVNQLISPDKLFEQVKFRSNVHLITDKAIS